MNSDIYYFRAKHGTDGFADIIQFNERCIEAKERTVEFIEKHVGAWRMKAGFQNVPHHEGGFIGLSFKNKCQPKGWERVSKGSRYFFPGSKLVKKASNKQLKIDLEAIAPVPHVDLYGLIFSDPTTCHDSGNFSVQILKDDGFITDFILSTKGNSLKLKPFMVEINESAAVEIGMVSPGQ